MAPPFPYLIHDFTVQRTTIEGGGGRGDDGGIKSAGSALGPIVFCVVSGISGCSSMYRLKRWQISSMVDIEFSLFGFDNGLKFI